MTPPPEAREAAVCANCHFPKDHPWHDNPSLPRWHTFQPAPAAPPPAAPEPYYRAIHDPSCAFRLAGSPHPCTCPAPAAAAPSGERGEDKYVQAAREYDEEDRRKLGVWVQANLQHHAGLSWSEAIAREFADLRARLAEVERREAAFVALLGEFVDDEECTFDHHGYCQTHSLGAKPCPNLRARLAIVARRAALGGTP